MAIRLEYAISAKCRPEQAWEKFSKIEQWPWWSPVIGKAKWVEGQPWQVGSRFYMEVGRPKTCAVKAVITESAPPNRMAWRARFTGATAQHWFSFEPQPDGSTLLKTWEDFHGWGTLFMTGGIREDTVQIYKIWFDALKFEAERIAREQLARS